LCPGTNFASSTIVTIPETRNERQVRRGALRGLTAVALAWMLVGCGAPTEDMSVPSGPVKSEHGLYVADLSFDPNPPAVGENSLQLRLETAGQPVVGADVAVETYMAAHGHMNTAGSMMGLDAGNYRCDDVVYNMPGTWQLTLKISALSGNDQVVVGYDVR
jgi:hypothetical protein